MNLCGHLVRLALEAARLGKIHLAMMPEQTTQNAKLFESGTYSLRAGAQASVPVAERHFCRCGQGVAAITND